MTSKLDLWAFDQICPPKRKCAFCGEPATRKCAFCGEPATKIIEGYDPKGVCAECLEELES